MSDTPEVPSSESNQNFNAAASREVFLKEVKPQEKPKEDSKAESKSWDSSKFFDEVRGIVSVLTNEELSDQEKEKKSVEFIDQNRELLETSLEADAAFPETANIMANLLVDQDMPTAQASALEFVNHNIDKVIEAIEEAEEFRSDVERSGIQLLAATSHFASGETREKAVQYLDKKKELIVNGLMKDPANANYYRAAISLMAEASYNQNVSTVVNKIVIDFADRVAYEPSQEENIVRTADVLNQTAIRAEKATMFVTRLLKNYDLDYSRLQTVWMENSSKNPEEHDFRKVLPMNLQRIVELENTDRGSAKILMDEFGIENFGRYPSRLLRKQFVQRDFPIPGYGVGIFPSRDHNGAFYGSNGPLESLINDLPFPKYIFRVVEAGSKIELARRLLSLDKRYGEQHKISFAIIGGHGKEELIDFGSDPSNPNARNFLQIEDLKGKGAGRTSQFFEPEPTIILASCSTGDDAGIGKKLSETMGAKVIAPRESTGISAYRAHVVDGKLDVSVEFTKENAQTFEPGPSK